MQVVGELLTEIYPKCPFFADSQKIIMPKYLSEKIAVATPHSIHLRAAIKKHSFHLTREHSATSPAYYTPINVYTEMCQCHDTSIYTGIIYLQSSISVVSPIATSFHTTPLLFALCSFSRRACV